MAAKPAPAGPTVPRTPPARPGGGWAGGVVPRILGGVVWRWPGGQYPQPVTHRFLRWLVLKSWREAPHIPLETFPAHYHCNVVPEGYRQNLYTRLALGFVDHLLRRGCQGIHGGII